MYSGFLHERIGQVTTEDIESVGSLSTTKDISPLQEHLQQSNPILWDYLRTELERLAPQDPSKKDLILLFVDNIFAILESHDDRSRAEEILQLTSSRPSDM